MLKAITFDFWNTLYKFPRDANVSRLRARRFLQIVNEAGGQVEMEELLAALEQCWKYADYCQRVEGYDITPAGHVNYILQHLNLQTSAEMWNAIYVTYTRALEEKPPVLKEGVKETLPLLEQKYTLAVICNTGGTPGTGLREFMRKDGILDYFSFLVFSDEVGWAKPNTRIFAHTLANLKVEPGQAAHIGDDPITDVIGAKKAGMKAIWLAPHAPWAVPECDYHVRQVNELPALFER